MQDTLQEICQYLRENAYQNEEQVRLSLVCRVLCELGWDAWNPNEVCAEFAPNRDEDNKKVDLALFNKSDTPLVFIETKAAGKIVGNLREVEKQVRDYNKNHTALFSIITDGQTWRFYYARTGGQFHEKCFRQFNFLEDELETIEDILKAFLTKDSLSGTAENEAKKCLQLTKLEKDIRDCLPEARRITDHNPRINLLGAVVQLLKEQRPSLTAEEVEKHWPKVDVNPPIGTDNSKLSPVVNPRPVGPVDFKHTKARGDISGKFCSNWRELVETGLAIAFDKGHTISGVRQEVDVNIQESRNTVNGFYPIGGHNASFQGMDANRSYRCLKSLAKILECTINLEITFGRKHPRHSEGNINIQLP